MENERRLMTCEVFASHHTSESVQVVFVFWVFSSPPSLGLFLLHNLGSHALLSLPLGLHEICTLRPTTNYYLALTAFYYVLYQTRNTHAEDFLINYVGGHF